MQEARSITAFLQDQRDAETQDILRNGMTERDFERQRIKAGEFTDALAIINSEYRRLAKLDAPESLPSDGAA
jgi:hypothetical protein